MRFTEISIVKWRNFRDIRIQIPYEVPLICLTGDNGAGKSNLLELLSSGAVRLGIASGIDFSRGDPFNEEHEMSLSLDLRELRNTDLQDHILAYGSGAENWDWTLVLQSVSQMRNGQHHAEPSVIAGGIDSQSVSNDVVNLARTAIQQAREVHYVYLDAERSFPISQLSQHEFLNSLSRKWADTDELRAQATQQTRQMYLQWALSVLTTEHNAISVYRRQVRAAEKIVQPPPTLSDSMDSYRVGLQSVLPHLEYLDVDINRLMLLFDSAGKELSFAHLSGGEREIAFIIGQIERFGLRQGLLLIDEPELHLNPSLIRSLLAYLKNSVSSGQIWIATHSLEAVETAGADATFLLEREPSSRIVSSVSTLADRPVIESLSMALGVPAFSLRERRFVVIEADAGESERERFYRLCGDPQANRFINGGGCDQVVKLLGHYRMLADASDEILQVGGVVDRDFRTAKTMTGLAMVPQLHVLEVHEIENMFLHPDVLGELLRRSGRQPDEVHGMLMSASDQFAGRWIVGNLEAVILSMLQDLQLPSDAMRAVLNPLKWSDFEANDSNSCALFVSSCSDHTVAARYRTELERSIRMYSDVRTSNDLWKRCMGKEVLGSIPRQLGVTNLDLLERQVTLIWEENVAARPAELEALRSFVESIGA